MSDPVELASHEWAPWVTDSAGERGTAVLVHGVAGWYRTWWRVGPALAERGWRVVAVDQRGHGRSPRIDGRVTVADWAADLAAFVERRGPPVALVGHSLGGAVAAELLAARPDLVRRAALEDPPAISRRDDLSWLERLECELVAAGTDLEAEVAREVAENPRWQPEDARQDVEGKQFADREGIVASFRADVGTRVLQLVPELRVPVLYLLAAEDRSVFPRAARDVLATHLPDGSRVEVLDAGHTIHRDQFEAYVSTVAAWLETSA